MKKTTNRGFTLIELLVVIAIIGILSSIVVATLGLARQKSRDARRVADIKSITTAVELYNDAHSAYPPTISVATLVTPGYMPALPTDPSDGSSYMYAGTGGTTCNHFHLGATLEDASSPSLSSAVHATATTTVCTGSNPDFTGSGAIYDVVQ